MSNMILQYFTCCHLNCHLANKTLQSPNARIFRYRQFSGDYTVLRSCVRASSDTICILLQTWTTRSSKDEEVVCVAKGAGLLETQATFYTAAVCYVQAVVMANHESITAL